MTLVLAVQGAFETRNGIAVSFAREANIQQAQLSLEELLRLQIDEENSVRGYVSTLDPFYEGQYQAAVERFQAKEVGLPAVLRSEGLTAGELSLDAYLRLQDDWRKEIAAPLLAHPNQKSAEIDKRTKAFSDYENRYAQRLRKVLADANAALARDTQDQVDRTLYVRALWLLIFGILAILFNAYRSQSNLELEQEKMTTDVLQRAFRSEYVPLPTADIGSAYRAAVGHLAGGGDMFDVYRLADRLALLLIADVSGKGVDAAVLTAFIKFTIRGIALRRRDPGSILAEFNTAFAQTVENPYLFVSMFVGVLDLETMQLRYASAGHDSAFLRRPSGVQQLAVTGPVLGVMEEPFDTKVVNLDDGDMLVLATDGLTEARDRSGKQIQETGAMALIEHGPSDPQMLADQLVAQVRKMGANRVRDDVAILAIRVREGRGSDGSA